MFPFLTMMPYLIRKNKVHQLRTLLPNRLLAPLAPVIEPKKEERSLPGSPQELYQQLAQAARAGIDEVKQFQTLWHSPEMKAIWEHVEGDIKESGGQLLQPTGTWEIDYDSLLEEMVKEEKAREEEKMKDEENQELEKLRSSGQGWRGVVEGFTQRNVPGVRVVPSKNEALLAVALIKAGIVFQVQADGLKEEKDFPDWRVSSRMSPGRPVTKLETSIVDCLNSRQRKWDLPYLLVSRTTIFDLN